MPRANATQPASAKAAASPSASEAAETQGAGAAGTAGYKRKSGHQKPAEGRADSRIMRVPIETYELIQSWADIERRNLNQQMAVIVEEWDEMTRAARAEAAARGGNGKR